MFIGVTKGFKYKMRYVYAHFPITGVINKAGHQLEIRNFLGEKRRRTVDLVGDTTVVKSDDVKDQIEVFGNNVEDVGRSCALISQACLVKKKDIRKFLDGIYVSGGGAMNED
jgi:large subunit ribosomal protein L9e